MTRKIELTVIVTSSYHFYDVYDYYQYNYPLIVGISIIFFMTILVPIIKNHGHHYAIKIVVLSAILNFILITLSNRH